MQERRFVAGRRAAWERLDALLARLDRSGPGRLDRADVDELALGYRAATSDLALARARAYDDRVVAYLDRLAARAHAYVYVGTSASGWRNTVRFVTTSFPSEVRRSWAAIAWCLAITVVAAVVSYRLTAADPNNAYAFLPAAVVPLIERPLHDTNFGFDRTFAPAMSAAIITNNVKVCAYAIAGGITAGIVTVFVIGFNGLMLGTLGALFAARGFGLDFWATIAPHGVLELSAVQIAGAAGFVLAAGLVRPGRVRRRDALAAAGRRAATLLVGVAGMLAIAGTIEGFVSPQRLDPSVRIAFGTLTAVLLAAYLALAGRSGETASPRRSLTATRGS